MSQIETIMLMVLGFVLALLLALFIGRGMWAYAVRAGKRRGDRDRPSDLARAQADRDQLRAEYAMLSRRLDLRLTDLKTRLAEQTAEVSRSRNRIQRLAAQIEEGEAALAAAILELGETRAQIEPLEAELARRTDALQKLRDQLRERDETITGLHQELAGAHAVIADRDSQLGTERTLQKGASDILREHGGEASQERLSRRIEELNLLSERIEAQRADLNHQHEAMKALKADIVIPAKEVPAKPAKRPRPSRRRKAAKSAAARAQSRGGTGKEAAAAKQAFEAPKNTNAPNQERQELDRVWNEKLSALGDATPGGAGRVSAVPSSPRKPDSAARPPATAGRSGEPTESENVISLASRIRALQKSISE